MNKPAIIVIAGCILVAGAAWTLASQLSGERPDYRDHFASSQSEVVSGRANGPESDEPLPTPATPPSPMESSTVATPASNQPPPRSEIPDNEFGELVRHGERVFNNPQQYASDYVSGELTCQNCHFDGGRHEKTAPLRSAWPMYPAYRSKNQRVNDYTERLQGCFIYSMNGEAPPRDSEVIQALQAYSYWLAKGMPTGEAPQQRGYPEIEEPPESPSFERGEAVFQESCALCHGEDGQGQKTADGTTGFPPLWGPNSYNWGAGMHRINTAAAFIKVAMPLGKPDLTVQQAWDVALFINRQERPQDPRFDGSVADTAERFHQHECEYDKGLIAP